MTFGKILKKKMAELELTQTEFAKKMNVHQTQVSEWVNDKVIPSMKTLNKISKVLDISLDDLMNAVDSKSIEPINKNIVQIPKGAKEEIIFDKFPSLNNGLIVPLLGEVSAGKMKESIEDPDKWENAIYVPGYIIDTMKLSNHLYALKIDGDSMIGEHICPGDIAICEWLPYERFTEYRSGDIVVAEYEGKITIKKLFTKRVGLDKVVIILEAANTKYGPIMINDMSNQFHPLGKLKTIIRMEI